MRSRILAEGSSDWRVRANWAEVGGISGQDENRQSRIEKFDTAGLSLHVFSIPRSFSGLGVQRRPHNRNPRRTLSAVLIEATKARVGDMVMRMGTWDKQLQGHRGRIRSKARLKEARKARLHWVELEGLERRTLLATIPAATATAGPAEPLVAGGQCRRRQRQHEQFPGGGRPDRSVEVGGGLGGQRPDDVGDHDWRVPGRPGRRPIRINGGQSWLPLLVEPTTTIGFSPGVSVDPALLDPDDVRSDAPLYRRDEPQPGVRRQRQLLHPVRVP